MTHPVLFIAKGACSLGAQITLEWVQVPYQVCITTAEFRATPEFRRINPTGKVGALKDGDIAISENLAILLHLAKRFDADKKYCPKSGTIERLKTYQWLSYLASGLHPAFRYVRYAERFVEPDYAAKFVEIAMPKLLAELKYINDSLNQHGYLITNTATIADAQAYALLRWCNGMTGSAPLVDTTQFPGLNIFLQQMEKDIAVKNALAIENKTPETATNSKFIGYI